MSLSRFMYQRLMAPRTLSGMVEADANPGRTSRLSAASTGATGPLACRIASARSSSYHYGQSAGSTRGRHIPHHRSLLLLAHHILHERAVNVVKEAWLSLPEKVLYVGDMYVHILRQSFLVEKIRFETSKP